MKDDSDLRKLFVDKRDLFTHNLVYKLPTCETGCDVTFRDHEEVGRIAKKIATNGYGMRDLVVAVTIT